MSEAQKKMEMLLSKAGIPHKEIRVFGSQILVTCYSPDAAEKFALLVGCFATVRGVVRSFDYLKDQKGAYERQKNPGLVKNVFTEPVWRMSAYIPAGAE